LLLCTDKFENTENLIFFKFIDTIPCRIAPGGRDVCQYVLQEGFIHVYSQINVNGGKFNMG
jgi:hypothetical protein